MIQYLRVVKDNFQFFGRFIDYSSHFVASTYEERIEEDDEGVDANMAPIFF
ncbi:hypothetical protein DFA_04545 [Cavenderia fasciculata]|uniref:Uncharacterized protein n=1 Tax=Cavenderia fasciculata TaxID=261658 RepID=F4PPW1_CACFS|nr:uncharacterized protein DFA_04545 [Cavenderia fasciculata]EGG22424.1 hypothetical protein DFA_04545 [Cavenderia fasciculata]|eukprot:XP_004360275.1 hypothetical protein DFA_04545 [Cavenderia fasciculata]